MQSTSNPNNSDYTPAGESGDSALQWVSIELLEQHDLDADTQREYLDPLEKQIIEVFSGIFHQAASIAFVRGTNDAAEYAITTLLEELDFNHIPESNREMVKEMVERRFEEKKDQYAMKLDDMMTVYQTRVENESPNVFAEWGAVV